MDEDHQPSQPPGRLASAAGMQPVRCGKCRGTNVGTEESLVGVALVAGYDPQTGEFEYTGETVVDYESSETQRQDGRIVMFCRDCCRHFLLDHETGREAAADRSRPADGAPAPPRATTEERTHLGG
jgi:hypothetical protein